MAPDGSRVLWWAGGTDPLGMFPLFSKTTAEVLAPRLAVVFRQLFRLCSFPVCWSVANVTPIPNGAPSSSVSIYRPISLTPILSKVFKRLGSVCLGHFIEGRGVLQTTSSLIGKVLALVMPFFAWHIPYRMLCRWGRRLE